MFESTLPFIKTIKFYENLHNKLFTKCYFQRLKTLRRTQ